MRAATKSAQRFAKKPAVKSPAEERPCFDIQLERTYFEERVDDLSRSADGTLLDSFDVAESGPRKIC